VCGEGDPGSRPSLGIVESPAPGTLDAVASQIVALAKKHHPTYQELARTELTTSQGLTGMCISAQVEENKVTMKQRSYLFDRGDKKLLLTFCFWADVSTPGETALDECIKSLHVGQR
jgi:hypothetical protein